MSVAFHGRRAAQLENDVLRVTVLEEGGHIAEVFDKRAGVSPLWVPHWTSIEPSAFGPQHTATFGSGTDARLLAGIMGHNLCIDLFGGPSHEEAAAGMTVHGEASVCRYSIASSQTELALELTMPLAELRVTRTIRLHGDRIEIRESVQNFAAFDRPIAWTQHVTLGPPFLDAPTTRFRASMTKSMVATEDPGCDAYLTAGAQFDWPIAPHKDGGMADLRQMHAAAPASGYTAHLADPSQWHAYFIAYAPQFRLAFGYVWKRAEFPWLGIWEENCSRIAPPWDGCTVTRGMEFGVSPFPETRREMVERGTLFNTPTYKWIGARETLQAVYWITSQIADAVPETLAWPES